MPPEKCSIERKRRAINTGLGCSGKKTTHEVIASSMPLQNIAVLTQHQPWQQRAGVEHAGSPDQTPEDNRTDASAAEAHGRGTCSLHDSSGASAAAFLTQRRRGRGWVKRRAGQEPTLLSQCSAKADRSACPCCNRSPFRKKPPQRLLCQPSLRIPPGGHWEGSRGCGMHEVTEERSC